MKRPRLPSLALAAAVVGGVLVYALAGRLVLVSPKRSDVSKLETEIVAIETHIAQARAPIRPGTKPARNEGADPFRPTKAMAPGTGHHRNLPRAVAGRHIDPALHVVFFFF